MAFGCIFVPNFMVQGVVRSEPELCERAVALVDGTAPVWSVVGVNEAAARAGIALGMTKSQAQQFCDIEIRQRSRAQEKAAHAALMDLGWSVSPRVEDTAADTIVLDLAGLNSLFGPDEKITAQLAERAWGLGLATQVAVAAKIDAAILAARGCAGVTVIPEGEEEKVLGNLPVGVLAPSAEVLETLERWGVRTSAELAALPVLQLSERLGQEGIRLHELARGASERSMVVAEPEIHFEEEMELEDAVEELEPLSFLLGRLLDQLCARLDARSMAACAVRVRFELDPRFEAEVGDVNRPSRTHSANFGDTRHSASLRAGLPGRTGSGVGTPMESTGLQKSETRKTRSTIAAPRLRESGSTVTCNVSASTNKIAGETPAPQKAKITAPLLQAPSVGRAEANKHLRDCAAGVETPDQRASFMSGLRIYERVLSLPVAMRDSKMLLKLVRLHLQADAPRAPILKIFLAADAARPRVAQGGLFLPSSPDPEKLELTVARLANLVGDLNVGSPGLVDTHRPGEFRMRRFFFMSGFASTNPEAPAREEVNRPSETGEVDSGTSRHAAKRSAGLPGRTGSGVGTSMESTGLQKSETQKTRSTIAAPQLHKTGFRVFRPALRAKVDLRDGCPSRVGFGGLLGYVVAASGPWRSSGDWWREDGWNTDEWDLEMEFSSTRDSRQHGFYRIYFDAIHQVWFVRGAYD